MAWNGAWTAVATTNPPNDTSARMPSTLQNRPFVSRMLMRSAARAPVRSMAAACPTNASRTDR